MSGTSSQSGDDEIQGIAALKPKEFIQVQSARKAFKLTTADKKSIHSEKNKQLEEIKAVNSGIRLAYISNIQATEQSDKSIATALHDCLGPGDFLTSTSITTPAGQLKNLISSYYFNEAYTFTGDEGDKAGGSYSHDHEWGTNFLVRQFCWTKKGLKMEDASGDQLTTITIDGTEYDVVAGVNGADDRIVLNSEELLSPKLCEVRRYLKKLNGIHNPL